MSGTANITINGYELVSWKDTYNKWYFRNDDEKINTLLSSLGVDDKTIFGYRASVDTMRRRLQLDGYDLRSAEKDFYDTKNVWIRDILDTLEEHRREVELHGHFLMPVDLYHLTEDLKVLKKTDFSAWLNIMPEALELMKKQKRGWIPNREEWNPLLYFMFSYSIGILETNLGFVNTLFPCMQMESYAVVLLNLSEADDDCILNISGLPSNIWSDFIEERGQARASETKFYNDFLDSLEELSELNKEKESPLLQRMIYSNVITSMEAYLSETMKRHVLNRHAIKRRFVEYYSFFDKNIRENKIFEFIDSLDGEINKQIDKISFHNKDVVVGLYKHVLLCDFPEKRMKELTACIDVRHDIVHRNGRSTDGLLTTITQDDVEKVIRLVHRIVEHIDKQIITGLPDDKMNIVK
ncbi:HEPN/Toprim-associated domain-containing protein [Aeromonas sp.]|uniref:HEPN/Toprim-associated domain-containing protein n=1 Tax=Aeromonas sp. TaxID=647 RepID=UPI0029105A9A|nr:HEPN/Toprim-associated domain-containing protein [Aeromonas sp.]MDU7582332.1 HEPN/Toprim-associated domain-containing protein [Aeromonas sp.]